MLGVCPRHITSQTRAPAARGTDATEGVAENVGDAVGVVLSRVNPDLERFTDFIEARQRETEASRGEVPVKGASQR